MSGYLDGRRQVGLYNTYDKDQIDSKFADKTSLTAQDFSAMPSVGGDPVVESGSNTDGEWTRWADGSQICSLRDSVDGVSWASAGTVYRTSNIEWTYPLPFTINPKTSFIFDNNSVWCGSSGTQSESLTTVRLWSYTDVGSTSGIGKFIAIGRWK